MAGISRTRTLAETGISETFDKLKGSLPGDLSTREAALKGFAEVGLPHRRVEEFKYTDLRAALRQAAPFAERPYAAEARAAVEERTAFRGLGMPRLAVVDGHVLPELSTLDRLPEGVEVVLLRDALAQGHPLLDSLSPVAWARANPLYQLNSAFMADGALIRVRAGAQVETPLHLCSVTTSAHAVARATRVLVVVEAGASLTLIESHESQDGAEHQPNDVVEAVVGDGANLRHVRLNGEGRDAVALSTLTAKLGAEASFDTVNVVVGAATSRHQVYLSFAGEHAKANVNGVSMLRGRQHADTTLLVDHAVPHGESRELFKTAIDDEATGVFQGKIIVQPHAQKTDGRMMSACLLLSEGGTMNNKPELEIFADDVQCAHGATCGQLDEDLLFYLMARGLPRREAESLMVQAFLGEALETVDDEALRAPLVAVVEDWLRARA